MPASKSPINLLRISYGVTDFTRFGLPGSTFSTDRRPSLEPGLQGLDGRRALCRVAQDYGNTALKINLGVGGLNPPEVAELYQSRTSAYTGRRSTTAGARHCTGRPACTSHLRTRLRRRRGRRLTPHVHAAKRRARTLSPIPGPPFPEKRQGRAVADDVHLRAACRRSARLRRPHHRGVKWHGGERPAGHVARRRAGRALRGGVGVNCFFPEDVINRYQQADRALAAAVAEMYATGTSTRKVQRVAERMGVASERGCAQ